MLGAALFLKVKLHYFELNSTMQRLSLYNYAMDGLLQNNIFLFYIVTLIFTSVAGIKRTERMRVALIYIFSVAMAADRTISAWYVIAGATSVLFILLEVLSDDEKRIQLLAKPLYKITDFLYRTIFEYYYPLFIAAVALLGIHLRRPYSIGIYAFSILLTLVTLALLMSQKYSTRSVTRIIKTLEDRLTIYQMSPDYKLINMLTILTDLEDREYFARSNTQHSIPLKKFFTKGWSYVKKHKGEGLISAFSSLFKRGYGTIEMQLIRTIGISDGYTAVYKRKVFEFLYANMIFNSYYSYLMRAGHDCSQYKNFILRQYIENVPVKINTTTYQPTNRSTLLQLFNKDSLEDISKEQFFVWCMGLTWGYVGDHLVITYADFLKQHGIDRQKVSVELSRLGRV